MRWTALALLPAVCLPVGCNKESVGAVTPLGLGRERLWRQLLAGRSAVGPVESFDAGAHRVNRAADPPAGRFHGLTVLAALLVPVLYTGANLADQAYRCGHPLAAGPAHEGCLSLPAGLDGMASAARLWLQAAAQPQRPDRSANSP